jgi:hypothetical protein
MQLSTEKPRWASEHLYVTLLSVIYKMFD